MKFSILLTLALSYTTLISAQNFRRDNADKAEQLQKEFAKLTKDSPCENNAQACVEDQFAQCVNGKFQLNSCGGGELKCVALPLVNKPGTSITCSTEADRLARLADARGEPPPNQGKDGKVPPDQDNGKDGKAPKEEDGKLPPNQGDGKNGNAPPKLGKDKDGKLPPDNLCKCPGNGNNNDDIDNGDDGNNDDGNNDDGNNDDGNNDDGNNDDGNNDDGNNGNDDNDGKDGNDGNDGNDGKDGNDGNDGNDGKDGNDGNDGNDGKDGNAPDIPKNQDKVQAPPANGDGNDLRRQNVAEAKALQEKFDKLKPDDECTDNEVACVENKFAQCSGGKFALTDCASGTVCAALPLVLKKGTTVACTTEADRDARLKQAAK